MKFLGNMAKTTATISPDEKYVLAGDENSLFFLWDTKYGKRFNLNDPTDPHMDCYDQACRDRIAEEVKNNVKMPQDFYPQIWQGPRNVAVKFIDEHGHFIRFIEEVNYATLYNVNSPKVKAFMDFGKHPQPNVSSVFRSANVIDTAPQAKVLVMGQSLADVKGKREGTGIIVYRFDDKTQTLKRLWAPEGPPPHKRISNPDNEWEY